MLSSGGGKNSADYGVLLDNCETSQDSFKLLTDGSEQRTTSWFYCLGIHSYFFLSPLLSSPHTPPPIVLPGWESMKNLFLNGTHLFVYLCFLIGWFILPKHCISKSLGLLLLLLLLTDSFGYRNICLLFKIVSYSLTSFSSCDE